MKAKLIRSENSYILKDGLNHVLGIDDKKLKDRLECPYLLSKQNCDEIFGVVDVEKLADILNDISIDLADYQNEAGKGMSTNEEWKDLFIERVTASITSYETSERPTEIEVMIEMYDFELPGKPIGRRVIKPKLDSSGCLILKRVV
jgi:hypothetical protein